MRSSDPDPPSWQIVAPHGPSRPDEEGIHLMSDTTSADLGTDSTTPIISVKPVTLAAPNRGDDLQVRVSAPTTGHHLPVIVFSHGFSQSMDSYAPLVDFWAGHGFVVVQPTHLDSRTLNLAPDDPRTPLIWRIRADDLTRTLDQLGAIEGAVPGLAGRVDHDRIAVAGHSWGAQTTSMLAGARVVGADGTPGESMADPRVKAAVLLALAGTGGADLTPFAAENFSFMNPDFGELDTPALIVAGDHDDSALTARGPDWFTDGYRLSPGATDLLTLFGGEHSLGGIQGYTDTATTDEGPERVAVIQQATLAYLHTALGLDNDAWPTARGSLTATSDPRARIDSK
jgi:pimeloyl-ACP methyl ester carboxylesterase